MVLYPSADEVRQRQQQAADSNTAFPSLLAGTYPEGGSLSQTQQDLLVAALKSNAGGTSSVTPQNNSIGSNEDKSADRNSTMTSLKDTGLFASPQQFDLDAYNGDYTPDLDYLDADGFDFENADLGGEMIGALPGGSAEQHEKRKNPDEDNDNEEGDAKRQETEEGEKSAKKPGRKPLTTEPTTKRKAQNRAAQRAFRERKEKHLKDLETKVSELTKANEADKHEKGLLKAQVERLQIELREYRKRLSLNSGSGVSRSPPLTAVGGRSNSNPTINGNGGFQFDFPKFGGLPGSQIFGNQSYSSANGSAASRGSVTPPFTQSPTNGSISGPSQSQPAQSRQNSLNRSMSPASAGGSNHASPSAGVSNVNPAFITYSTANNMHGFASTLPQMTNTTTNDPFGDLFSPSILKSASADNLGNYFTNNGSSTNVAGSTNDFSGGDTSAGLNRVFQFNAGSSSDSASPSASSASQWNANANSSCGTSPEPSHDSPKTKDSSNIMPNTAAFDSTAFDNNAVDYSMPFFNSFDPMLYNNYRDNNDTLLGGGDFNGGFFDDNTFNSAPFDLSSPSNLFGILQSPKQPNTSLGVPSAAANAPTPSKNLMAEMDRARDGGDDDYGLPTTAPAKKMEGSGKLISCNNIWNQLQSNPDFQEGKFDLDGLCSELRAKARCSESGVMVDQEHVDAALRKLGKKDERTGKEFEAPHGLMFEQESWDKVLRKLGDNSA